MAKSPSATFRHARTCWNGSILLLLLPSFSLLPHLHLLLLLPSPPRPLRASAARRPQRDFKIRAPRHRNQTAAFIQAPFFTFKTRRFNRTHKCDVSTPKQVKGDALYLIHLYKSFYFDDDDLLAVGCFMTSYNTVNVVISNNPDSSN